MESQTESQGPSFMQEDLTRNSRDSFHKKDTSQQVPTKVSVNFKGGKVGKSRLDSQSSFGSDIQRSNLSRSEVFLKREPAAGGEGDFSVTHKVVQTL